MASYFDYDLLKVYQKCTKFYDIDPVVGAKRSLDSGNDYYIPNRDLLPKDLNFKDVTFLLSSLFSKNSLNFEEFTKHKPDTELDENLDENYTPLWNRAVS